MPPLRPELVDGVEGRVTSREMGVTLGPLDLLEKKKFVEKSILGQINILMLKSAICNDFLKFYFRT